MVTNRAYSGRAMSIPAGVLLGAVFSLLWSVILAGLLALLIHREILDYDTLGYGAMGILLTASMLGSMLAWKKIKHRRALVCMSAGGVYFLMLLGSTALFFGGQYEAVGETALIILAGSGTATLMGMGRGDGTSRMIRKKLHGKFV